MVTRRIIEVLELRQKRCGLRFGLGACTAAIGPKVPTQCLNTYGTCPVKSLYDPDAQIRWLFVKPGSPLPRQRAGSGNDIISNAYPILRSVTFSTQTKMNPGGSRKGESPFGVFGTFSASLDNFRLKDHIADHYGRGITGPFWPLFKAMIGEAVAQLEAYVYRGYAGQTLDEMQVMRYDVQALDAKVGGCEVKGQDPTARTAGKKAQFPRASDLQLAAEIDAATTDLVVVGNEDDLTAQFGNVLDAKAIRIGSEVIRFTGYTAGTGNFTLAGVVRGFGNTVASTHSRRDLCQSVGWYRKIELYRIAQDLMENHAGLGGGLIDNDEWSQEGGRYLPTLRVRETFVTESTAVEDLVAELMRDGMFSAWWDAFAAKIPLLAVRPPEGVIPVVSDRSQIIAPGVSIESRPDDRITRVVIYYNQINPALKQDEKTNYRNGRLRILANLEGADYADGSVRELAIYSRWISSDAQALLVGASLLRRFGVTPEYTTIKLDAKDTALSEIGTVVSVDTFSQLDAFGGRKPKNWQVIGRDEPEPGHVVSITLQTSEQSGRFAVIMANDAPDYATATDAERLNGCWLADDATGLMPNGDDPYLIQ
jgi:hypothetical protein